jgi:3-O-methylgallate 3,4-dioxygenase
MAKLVLGIGTSHAPQLSLRPEKWHLLREKDQNDKRFNFSELAKSPRPGIANEITPAKMAERYSACMQALAKLGEILQEASPDILVVVGDDQHENFLDDNMPVFCVYKGPSVTPVKRDARRPWRADHDERVLAIDSFKSSPDLAEHIIRYLISEGFDVASSNKLRPDVGLGHAFTAIYTQIMLDGHIPIVPFMVNTFFPPNQPTPSRCYALGASLRKAIEAWDAEKRVGVIASGGLSHVIIDEEIDRMVIEGLQNKDKKRLIDLPVEKLVFGTSEIRNWILVAGAVEDMNMKLLDYVPCYRSEAGTGCAMAFAQWF